MIEFDKFIYFYMHKCACSYTRLFLEEVFGNGIHRESARVHIPVQAATEKDRQKLWVANIRNPWKWYVSFYHFTVDRYAKGVPRFEEIFLTEDKTIRPFEDFLPFLFSMSKVRYSLTNFKVMSALNIGLYTYRYLRMCSIAKIQETKSPFHISFCENRVGINHFINADKGIPCELYKFFKEYNIPFEEEKFENAKKIGITNTSKHNDYRTYYTPELIKLVEEKDKLIVEKFNYTFEEKND